jgi:hypothetical protein
MLFSVIVPENDSNLVSNTDFLNASSVIAF